MTPKTTKDILAKLRSEFEDLITDPDLVQHLDCGGFEYQHLIADIFEKVLDQANQQLLELMEGVIGADPQWENTLSYDAVVKRLNEQRTALYKIFGKDNNNAKN